jgi:hypothetical protein
VATCYCDTDADADTWYSWTTTASTVEYTWKAWVVDATSCSDATTVWTTWNTSTASGSYVVSADGYVDKRTAEQKAADEARWAAEREQVRVRAAEAEVVRKAARAKARKLLESLLTEAQRESLAKRKFFEVVAQSGRRYRIKEGTHGNVVELNDDGKEVMRWCGQPGGVPDYDANAAQMLQLRFAEAEFRRLSNGTRM